MTSIAKNIEQTLMRVRQAQESAGRPENAVTLLAVSKTRPAEDVESAYLSGVRDFGENYLQDALPKIEQLQDLADIHWHFIGPLQSNKTRQVAEHFHWVHSVDRLKIARRLSEQRPETMPPLNVCIQVNINEEPQKAGVDPAEVQALAEQINGLPGICLRGLMAIPAAGLSEEQQHQTFARMRRLFADLQSRFPEMDTLSMGMSDDMAAAIAEGSTLVRIGTAIFGPRSYNRPQE